MEINKRPIGLIILLVYLIFGAVSHAVELIQSANYFMLFGYIVQGIKVKILEVILLILYVLFIIGLYRYRRWAYFGCIISFTLAIILSISNVIFVDTNRIIEMGWKLRSFYFFHGLVIIGNFPVLFCLFYYGDKFLSPTDRIVQFFRGRINNCVTKELKKHEGVKPGPNPKTKSAERFL